jgi:hypothetical protein
MIAARGLILLVLVLATNLFLSASRQSDDKYAQFDSSVHQVFALMSSGDDSKAIIVGEPALQQGRGLFKSGEPKLIDFEGMLALAYMRAGRWQDAQSLLLSIIQSGIGPSVQLRDAEFSLGLIAGLHGAIYEGNQRLRVALAVASSLPTTEEPAAQRIRNSLALSDLEIGNIPEALELTWQNLDYVRTHSGETSHREELLNLRTLASIYRSIGDRKREDGVCTRLQQISMTSDEKSDTELLILARDRDRLFSEGNFKAALQLQLQAITRTEKVSSSLPIARAQGLQLVAEINYAAGQVESALESFRQDFHALHQAYDESFALMTDSERNEFAGQLDSTLNIFYSMCYTYRTSHPECLAEMYNLVLWQKNLVTRSLTRQQQLLTSSNDDLLGRLQRDLRNQRIQVAEVNRENPNAPSLASFRQRQYDIEKRLAQRLSQISGTTTGGPDVGAVLKVLRPEEAAVEFIRLPFNDGPAPTSKVLYLALVARTGNQQPLTLVELGDAETLEQDQVRVNEILHHRGFVTNPDDAIQVSKVWRALEPSLKGAKRVYLSPAGIFNQSAFFAWKASDDSFLIDHDDLDLRPVSSTAVLLDGVSTIAASSAVLIGNPEFNRSPSGAAVSSGSDPVIGNSSVSGCVDVAGEALPCLPNSAVEVETIYSTLKSHGWDVLPPYESTRASKTAVLASHHPRVLHLATHGFFTELNNAGAEIDPLGLEMQLESSGLFFAGANLTLQHLANQSSDNGVLTSFEALNLDLDGTELVVLSACDTGRGQLSNADEVLGLRRSFQVAGAKSILMSVVNVNDLVTTELMTKFYEEWVASGDAYNALRKAALEVKRNHPNPYYWAPFALYGGK